MKAYLTSISAISLVGLYVATFVLGRVAPGLFLGVKDDAATRSALATALGVVTTMLPLWLLHWSALRRLWARSQVERPSYLFVVTSLTVVAAAITAGRLMTQIATLLLSTTYLSSAAWAGLFSALFLSVTSFVLWYHHYRLLRQMVGSARPGPAMVGQHG
ncbi:MAG: hypothetical protein ACE5H9_16625 [Anaerolineae bacterium]